MITSLKQNGERKNKSVEIDTGQGTWVCLVNREQLYIYKINDSKEKAIWNSEGHKYLLLPKQSRAYKSGYDDDIAS